jgi:arabinose-5-phosphate isomerase
VVLLENRGFTARDFRDFHPGGKLGAKLKHVSTMMRGPDALPLVAANCLMSEALLTMTAKSLGCLGVCDSAGKLIGVITDGDLRRHMSDGILNQHASAIMTKAPKTIPGDALASEALEALTASQITSMFIINEKHQPIGLIHIHDLLSQGVV